VLHEPACELQPTNRGIRVVMIWVSLEISAQRDEPPDFVRSKITL
jgi:hypothetical protein